MFNDRSVDVEGLFLTSSTTSIKVLTLELFSWDSKLLHSYFLLLFSTLLASLLSGSASYPSHSGTSSTGAHLPSIPLPVPASWEEIHYCYTIIGKALSKLSCNPWNIVRRFGILFMPSPGHKLHVFPGSNLNPSNDVTVREHQSGHAGLVPGNAADAEEELAAVIGVGVLGEGTIWRRAFKLLWLGCTQNRGLWLVAVSPTSEESARRSAPALQLGTLLTQRQLLVTGS